MRVGELEIPIPEDWEDRSLYTYIAPAKKTVPMRATQSTFRKNVVIQKRGLADDETLASCTAGAVAKTKDGFGGIAVDVVAGPKTEAVESSCLTYKLVDPVTNMPVGQILYVCLLGRAEWQIAVSVPATELVAVRAEFDAIVGAIRRA